MQIFPDCGCGCKGKEQEKKFVRALVLGILFFVIANPELFTVTRKLFGYRIASATGYPTLIGLVLHAFVFFLVSWGLMNLKKSEKMTGSDWATQKSNTSPDSISDLTNWSPSDYTGGKPPASSPGGPVPSPTTLPEPEGIEQPYMPVTPAQPVDQKSWAEMPGVLGMDVSGASSWQTCTLGNGKQVRVQN